MRNEISREIPLSDLRIKHKELTMKKIILTISLIIVAGLGAVYLTSAFLFGNTRYFYTQIDNSKYTISIQKDKTYYTYRLTAYDENGKEHEWSFDTLRELRSLAYLKLETSAMGVINWEEIQWSEIPQPAQEKLVQ